MDSSAGATMWHGAHQGAQKSTRTDDLHFRLLVYIGEVEQTAVTDHILAFLFDDSIETKAPGLAVARKVGGLRNHMILPDGRIRHSVF